MLRNEFRSSTVSPLFNDASFIMSSEFPLEPCNFDCSLLLIATRSVDYFKINYSSIRLLFTQEYERWYRDGQNNAITLLTAALWQFQVRNLNWTEVSTSFVRSSV